MNLKLWAGLIVAVAIPAHAQTACAFKPWTTYQTTNLLRHESVNAYIFQSRHIQIDADGAPNAYHPSDAGKNCKTDVFIGLDCLSNAGRHSIARQPPSVGPRYVQEDGPFQGFHVSMTSLMDETKAHTDPARYVDASTVPYFVFPGDFYRMAGTGVVGDVGYAINLSNGSRSPFVVAETGLEHAPLGEMSIALAAALGGVNPNARTGRGAPQGTILYVLFPRSLGNPPWPVPAKDLTERAVKLLASVGGEASLLACADSKRSVSGGKQ